MPVEPGSVNLILLNSVLSHMEEEDVRYYLGEFARILPADGAVFATAFLEDDVPEVSVNPEGYVDESVGALHRVRFEKDHFFRLVEDAGFQVARFVHQGIQRTKQSTILMQKG